MAIMVLGDAAKQVERVVLVSPVWRQQRMREENEDAHFQERHGRTRGYLIRGPLSFLFRIGNI